MQMTCPTCGEPFPLAAGLAGADGQRLAELAAAMEPRLALAALEYVGLFGAKTLGREARIMADLAALVAAGTVRREGSAPLAATPALWAQAIEQMLAQRAKLRLPLSSHGYLQAIAHALADAAAAAREANSSRRAADAGARAFDRPQAMNDALEKLSIQRAEDLIANHRRSRGQGETP